MSIDWFLLVRDSITEEGVLGSLNFVHFHALIINVYTIVNFTVCPVPCALAMSHALLELFFHSLSMIVAFNAKAMLFIIQESSFDDRTVCPLNLTFTTGIVIPVKFTHVD